MEIVPAKLIRISRYYMVAAIVYFLATLLIGVCRVIEPIPSPLVHWAPAVLGWISFAIMGAYYQFFPTLQGRDLRFDNLTLPQFFLANLGLVGMMASAWTGSQVGLAVSTVIYTIAALGFAAIIVGNTSLGKMNLTLRFYLMSLTYFVGAMVLLLVKALGVSVVWASQPFLLHILAFGWAVVAIMGAEYSMVPMLQLKNLRHPKLADAQFYVVNLGFWGLAYSFATANLTLIALAGTLAFVGIAIFAYIVYATLKHGPSRLPRMDVSVKYFSVGVVYLVLTALAGILIAATRQLQFSPIHVHLGLVGAISITIVGAMYHIVPFVVWWEVYAPKLGLEDVPLLHQLYNLRSATWQLYGLNAGLILMIAGFALSASLVLALGGIVLILTALAFAWEMLRVLGHRRNLNAPASSTKNTSKNVYGGVL